MLDFASLAVQIARMNKEDTKESILGKLIELNGQESTFPQVMAIDMMFAGIDSTGNSLGFLMYHLATNPDKQERLREECMALGKSLTLKDLNGLSSVCCLVES